MVTAREKKRAPVLMSGASARTAALRCSLLVCALLLLHILVIALILQARDARCRGASVAAASGGGGEGDGERKEGSRGDATRPPRFILYRLIGNNMPPLQCASQLLWNTLYALKHEGPLRDCRKRWVLNQIVNATERALIIDALLTHGHSLDDILIRWLNISQIGEGDPKHWLDAVTSQNEARNMAIEDGIADGAKWILPFDGNHFITNEAWESIIASADTADMKGFKYFKVPVFRLHRQQSPAWVNARSAFARVMKHAPIMIESQLAFRFDSSERFRPGMVYGMQNKLEMLSRACGRGAEEAGKERCGCSDLGVEGQPHDADIAVTRRCGYSLRLWFFPCNGTDPQKVFFDGKYRQKMRTTARRQMMARIKYAVRHPRILEP